MIHRSQKNTFEHNRRIDKGNIQNYLTPDNKKNARAALIRYSQGKDLIGVDPARAGKWSAVKQQDMAESQRAGKITGEVRLTVRQLIQMERELEFLDNLVMTEPEPPPAPTQVLDGEQELEIIIQQHDADREWYEGDFTDWLGITGGEPESATEAGQNRGMKGGS